MSMLENVVRISFRHEDFRVAMGAPFRPVAVGAILVSEIFFMSTGTSNWQMLLFIIPATVLIVCAAILMLMCLSYKFEVGPDGIQWHDSLWKTHHTSWQSLEDVKIFRLFGLSYLVVKTREHSRAIWIPLFVTRYEVLRELLINYADSSFQLENKLHSIA